MSFINNLIERLTASATDIKPRLRGKFERSASPSESIEEIATGAPAQSTNETFIEPKRTELITRKQVIEERSEKIVRPAKEITQKQIAEQPVPVAKPERPSRFEPSHNLVVQAANVAQPNFYQDSVHEQPKQAAHIINQNNEIIHQHVQHKPVISPVPSLITKEIHKPIPADKPTGNNIFRIEPQQKAQQKQSPAASFIQRNTVKTEPSRTINISIGKIEVRVQQPPVQNTARPKKEGIPIMGLDEYLEKRNQRSQ